MRLPLQFFPWEDHHPGQNPVLNSHLGKSRCIEGMIPLAQILRRNVKPP